MEVLNVVLQAQCTSFSLIVQSFLDALTIFFKNPF